MQKNPRQSLSVEQKVAFVLLLILGMGGLILGMLSFGSNIRRPFDMQIANYTGETVYGTEEMARRELETLKNKDSDQDGISDYDELYVFKTSPYLADTDSDGIDDRTEIFAGEDPNCPRGKECGAFFVGEDISQADATVNLLSPISSTGSLMPTGNFGGMVLESPEDILEYFANLSTDEIRDLMKQQGVPEDTLNQLDDASLRELIETSLTQAMAENQFGQFLPEDQTEF